MKSSFFKEKYLCRHGGMYFRYDFSLGYIYSMYMPTYFQTSVACLIWRNMRDNISTINKINLESWYFPIQGNFLSNKKKQSTHMQQCWWIWFASHQAKEARFERLHIVWFHLYDFLEKTTIQGENRLGVQGAGSGLCRWEGLITKRHEQILWDDGTVLHLH